MATAITATTMPPAIRGLNQWVVWKFEDRAGKKTKVPYQASDPTRRADSTNPATWSSLEDAVAASTAAGVAGVGFVFAPGGGIVGIDLDKCVDRDMGTVEPWAADIVARFLSYTEVTPSGTGIHIIVKGKLPEGRRRKGQIEMYDSGRFFTMTGDYFAGMICNVEEKQAELDAFHGVTFSEPARKTPSMALPAPAQAAGGKLSDLEIVMKAGRSKNGAKFARLWSGDAGDYAGDMSSATMALCSILAFWTGRDAARMDGLVRQSGLMRPKWDERRGDSTWGQQTLQAAIDRCTEVYDPGMADDAVSSYLDLMSGLPPGTTKAASAGIQEPPETLREPGADEDADEPTHEKPAVAVAGLLPVAAPMVQVHIDQTVAPVNPDEPEGGISRRPYITNMVQKPSEDGEETVNCYVKLEQMAAVLTTGLSGWPKSSGGRMFVQANTRHVGDMPSSRSVRFLTSVNSMSAWIHERADLHFAKATHAMAGPRRVSLTTKNEFFESLHHHVDKFQGVEMLPHHPAVDDIYYWPCPLPPSDGLALAELMDHLNPETEQDRDLMLAALMTPAWGGPPGARPAFVFTSIAGRGAGKTSTAELFASIWGGAVMVAEDEDWQQVTTRLLSDDSFTSRIVMIDNIKARLSRSGLESAITAATINGRRLYVGQASRPNLLTWYLTANNMDFSRDLTQRAIIIKVGKPKHGVNFSGWANEFVATRRAAVISDIMAMLKSSPACEIDSSVADRWRAWQLAVLSRFPRGMDLAQKIALDRAEADSDTGDAGDIVGIVHGRLNAGNYSPDSSCVIIKPRDLHDMLVQEGVRSRADTQRTTTRWMRYFADVEPVKSRLHYQLIRVDGQPSRAWIWTGEDAGEVPDHTPALAVYSPPASVHW